jgi:lysophospholipase L1-like esterase
MHSKHPIHVHLALITFLLPVLGLSGARLNAASVIGGLPTPVDFLTSAARQKPPANEKTAPSSFKFSFSPGKVPPGYVQVLPGTAYTSERGYGFDLASKVASVDRGGDNPLHAGYCTSEQPFFFSVNVPEGNYNVTITLGDLKDKSAATVRAESRRLMLENVQTESGKIASRTITVNVRNSKLRAGGQVKLKDRELNGPYGGPVLHWDDKLTLEFSGARPCVCSLAIAKVNDAITVYLAGDSTVTDQTKGAFYSWGQILPRFFKPGAVAISNHAESGEATTSFIGAKRLEKILDTLKKGDYLFVQFGHNDQNQKRTIDAYKTSLKRYIAEARKREAIPVLVTPMRRRTFDGNGKSTNSLGDYPEAVREVSKAEKVMLIDLHTMSKDFYEALSPMSSKLAFVDNTHTNDYGAYEFARYVVAQMKASDLSLAKYVVDDLPPPNFNGPAKKALRR